MVPSGVLTTVAQPDSFSAVPLDLGSGTAVRNPPAVSFVLDAWTICRQTVSRSMTTFSRNCEPSWREASSLSPPTTTRAYVVRSFWS